MIGNTIEPFLKTDADYQRRLINFATGRFDLLPDHIAWLNDLLHATPSTREFHCHIYGYASKLGSTGSNETLSFNRATAVARYLETSDPRYTVRIEMFKSMGEEDPSYVARESDNDGRWRAVEVHVKFDKPPHVKPHVRPLPKLTTHMKWSVSGYFSLMTSVWVVAQFGVSLFKFRNDENFQVRHYVSPMTGMGGGYDAAKLLKWLRSLKTGPNQALAKAVEHLLKRGTIADPYAALKEIGLALLTGTGVQDWTDFSKCDVYLPLTFNILDGKDIGNVSVTPGIYQFQKIYVSGKVWYRENSGGRMFGNRDLLRASSSGWVAQVPALAAGAVGGPLLLI